MVRFLSYSLIDWKAYIEEVQDILGKSPTRCLDRLSIPIEKPSAFITSLHNLIEGDTLFRNLSILKSVQVSFIFHISTQCALDMLHFSGLNFVSAKAQDSMYLSIVSGTLYDWREAVILGSQESQSEEVRNTFNQCYIILINSGFKFVWKDYKRIKLKDGTLLLKA